ncbi:CBO0543 family protein [Desulfofundulus luciae]|nr:CBO0543 family protein [Desulfofundulus luciae]
MWFVFSLGLSILAVGKKGWLQFWPVGLVALAVAYILDSTLIDLGAFSYHYGVPALGGLPLLYLLSVFPNGIILSRFYPSRRRLRLPYVLVVAALFLFVERLMFITGNFRYLHWTLEYSLMLNVTGMILVLWLGEWLGVIKPGE